jgi:hypothetical protein
MYKHALNPSCFQVLRAAGSKMTASGIERRIVSLKHTDVSEVHSDSIIRTVNPVHASETSIYSNETTWHHIPEGCNLHHPGLIVFTFINGGGTASRILLYIDV